MMARTLRFVAPAFAIVAFATAPQAAQAQWPPDSLVNVQVLDKDMPVRQVVGVMRGFAGGLGVRCTHCHVGENSQDLASIDFVSDEKPTKRKAREMLRMVRTINDEILADLPERSDPPIEVTCATCHHGVTKPQSIQDILTQKASEEGAEADIWDMVMEEVYRPIGIHRAPIMRTVEADGNRVLLDGVRGS